MVGTFIALGGTISNRATSCRFDALVQRPQFIDYLCHRAPDLRRDFVANVLQGSDNN